MPTSWPGYRTISQIGVGARSTISHVVNESGEPFALKRVVRNSADDDRFIEQAENEFEVSSKIDHPALRKSFDIQRTKKWFKTRELLILMEYATGETLDNARPDDLPTSIALFRRIGEALQALHDAGYVHADIKPNNILIDRDAVKIIDFGQSCPIGHKKDRIQGTPDYIAPEQVRKMPLDQRTDVFNLGATMYWVLTGHTFPTDMQAHAGSNTITGLKRTPKEINEEIPATLSALVMDCCQENPQNRPKDMQQLIARLNVAENILKGGLNTEKELPQDAARSAETH